MVSNPLLSSYSPPLTRVRSTNKLTTQSSQKCLANIDSSRTTDTYKPEIPPALPKKLSQATVYLRQSPNAMRMEKRRKFRQLERRCSENDWLEDERLTGAVFKSGIFDCLEDECLVEIMHAIVKMEGFGLDLRTSVLRGASSLCALIRSCKRMNAVFCVMAPALRLEMSARAATQIVPKNIGKVIYPFTEQLRLETRSSDQLKLLRETISALATHCAGKCCEASRRGLNKDIRKTSINTTQKTRRAMVAPATEHANTLAASADGACAFISLRKRVSKRSEHGSQRCEQYTARRHEEWVVCVGYRQVENKSPLAKVECYEKSSVILGDVDCRTRPHSMRSSQNGSMVAMIRGILSSSSIDDAPHSCVQLWKPDDNVSPLLTAETPGELEMVGAINAQDAWFFSNNKLAVLWSTGYVHPCGSVVGASAESACYGIAVYDVCAEDLEIDAFFGPWPGKAQTVSPTATGTEVLLVVRMPTVGVGPSAHSTLASFLHRVGSEDRFVLDHSSVMGSTAFPRHPLDVMNSPSAAAISPTGDCVVAVHRSRGTVIVEVLLRTSESTFVSVQSTDVTHYTTIGNGEPSVFDPPGTNAQILAAALRLPYTIVFSPCGRFATIIDQRPVYGLTLTNHAFVVLDLALRHERCGIRVLPLASVEEVAPRGLQWTDAGLWVQARHGALLLWSP